MRMGEKELFALSERDGMRGNGAKTSEGGTRTPDKLMLNVKDGFRDHAQVALNEQVVNADDGASEGVFHRSKKGVGGAFGNGLKCGVEGGARNRGNGFAEELNGGGLAEGARLTLKGDTNRPATRRCSVRIRCQFGLPFCDRRRLKSVA